MDNDRKRHFAERTDGESVARAGIWALPDDLLEHVTGGLITDPKPRNFTQRDPGGGIDFAQNYSCFAQNIGDFSEGTPPP